MTKVKKNCRICGKEYTPCSYCENDQMAFHYRTICCSRKCAEVYLSRVLEARQKTTKVNESDSFSQESATLRDDAQTIEQNQIVEEKPKRKYTRKKQVLSDSEDSEQIEKSEGASD